MRKRDMFWALTDIQKRIAAVEVRIESIEAQMAMRIDHVDEKASHNASIIEDLGDVKHTVAGIKTHLEKTAATKAATKKSRVQTIVTFILALASGMLLEWWRHR